MTKVTKECIMEMDIRRWKLVGLFILAMAVSGCTGPVGPQKTDVSYSVPVPNGYYTGVVPDFSTMVPNDPLGRKFRIAYLWIQLVKCSNLAMAQDAIAKGSANPYLKIYMNVREQVSHSPFTGNLRVSTKKLMVSNWKYNEACLDCAEIEMADSNEDQNFVSSRKKADYLTSELAKRYPNLFSENKTAFPLDVFVVAAYDPTEEMRMRTLYEGWLIGLPEHSNIRENFDKVKKAVFPVEEGWLSPYDAIAAALFKLSAEQFSGLEAANPNDHYWLEQ